MIDFTCPRCNTPYQYPDAMAGNKIRCSGPNCNQKLLIPPPTTPFVAAPPLAPTTSSVSSGPAERLWNYLGDGQARGPVPAAELKRRIADGRLTPNDPIWTAGMSAWRPAREALPELFRKPAGAKPRRDAEAGNNARGGLFEKIGIGVFAVVAAVILVGLFMILFPLIRNAANHAPAVAATAGDGKDSPAPAAGQEMKIEDVVALCKPSVALVKHREGSGSGFLVDGGYVVTNSHVVAPDTIEAIVVTFPSSDVKDERYKVRLAYEDRKRDLAVLKIENVTKLKPLPLCMGKISDGQPLVTIGSPGVSVAAGGLSVNAVAPGSLSKQDFRSDEDGLVYLQYTAPTNPGNSGGPVLNLRGEVIGVHDAAMAKLDGVKLAIPVSDLQAILAKAKSRNAAAAEHATAAHDARILAMNLAKTTAQYLGAAKLCAKQAREAVQNNQRAGDAYAATREAIADAQKKDQTKLIDPAVARAIYLDEPGENHRSQWDEITDLLSDSQLDDGVRAKLRQLRDMYLQTKGVYESPPGTIDDVEQQLDTIDNEFPKLAESIDAEFGSVF